MTTQSQVGAEEKEDGIEKLFIQSYSYTYSYKGHFVIAQSWLRQIISMASRLEEE